jgi:hypothetical protein
MEMGGLSQEVVDKVVVQAEAKAAEAEAAALEQRRKQREADRLAAAENVDEGTPEYLAESEKTEPEKTEPEEPKADEQKPDEPSAGASENV